MQQISFEDFSKIDLRVGTIVDVQEFPEARKPAYKLWVDLGDELGVKKSSAQITKLYNKEELIGRQVLAVVNFSARQIASFMSEILVTGFVLENAQVVLACPERAIPNGTRLA